MYEWYVKQGLKHAASLAPQVLREPIGLRMRRRAVRAAESWPLSRIRAYQLLRVNSILAWAANRVPHYRDQGLARTLPLRCIEDLRQWPVVERSTVAADPQSFLATGLPRWRTRCGTTTGRSGSPLSVRWEWPSAVWWETAFQHRIYRWAGLPAGFRRVVLRGSLTHGPGGTESRWWQYVPHRRTLVLSVFQLSGSTVERYVRTMGSFRPHALQAYPSAAAKLVRLAREKGLALPRLAAILTSSETLGPEDRELVEQDLGPVFDFYGHAERAIAAAQCELRRGYHLFDDYGYAEVLDCRGEACGPGQTGELTGTVFHNRAMPLIRYRSGDWATLSSIPCTCGRQLRVLSALEGRPPDYLVNEEGEHVSLRFGLGSADLRGIEELRFYQGTAGVADVRYVGASDPAIPARLLAALLRRTGRGLKYRIERVHRLPPVPGGKAVLVVHSGEAP
ncbi:MAG: hypothetical protein MUE60_10340 [Candidatus Eisenbacteria bacterium]|nr:hypothetical protein [Candidatus Eisenbacteria bacterium]